MVGGTAELDGEEDERKVLQSLMRGGNKFVVFYSWNPPKSINNWVNQDVLFARSDTSCITIDYRGVPAEWLGEQFLIEAEHLKETKPKAYEHEYLGVTSGTGGQVFDNVAVIRKITAEELARFDQLNGLDWGYAAEIHLHYSQSHYDKTRRRLFILVNLSK